MHSLLQIFRVLLCLILKMLRGVWALVVVLRGWAVAWAKGRGLGDALGEAFLTGKNAKISDEILRKLKEVESKVNYVSIDSGETYVRSMKQ